MPATRCRQRSRPKRPRRLPIGPIVSANNSVTAASAADEHRLALLDHGARRFTRVFGRHLPRAVLLLAGIAVFDRHELDFVERLLAETQAERRLLRDDLSKASDRRAELGCGHDFLDQADAIGFGRGDWLAGEEHAAQHALRNEAADVSAAAATADIDLRQAEGRGLAGG